MMAVELDDLLNALVHEWADGFDRLNEFEQLFGEAEHVELLNLVGGAFFADVQRVLWDDQLLRVTRLTDPKQTGKGDKAKDNLTVYRLLDFCESHELRKQVEEQVEVAKQAAEFARPHRNKRISHNDLDFAIGGSDLPSTTLRQIREALDAVHAVLQTVSRELRRQYLPKETIDRRPGGVVAFLHRIQVLVDAGFCVEGLLAHLSDQAPPLGQGCGPGLHTEARRHAFTGEGATDRQPESHRSPAAYRHHVAGPQGGCARSGAARPAPRPTASAASAATSPGQPMTDMIPPPSPTGIRRRRSR